MKSIPTSVGFVIVLAGLVMAYPLLDKHEKPTPTFTPGQLKAQRDLERDLAVAAWCREWLGEYSGYTYSAAGEPTCIPKSYMHRGKK